MTTKLKRLAILIGLSTILSVNSYSTLDDSLVARAQIEKRCEVRQSQRLEQRISDFKRDEKPGIYALLVAGSETPLETWTKAGREEFYISTKIAYECLKKKGVDPDNIFVLDKYERTNYYPADGLCTKANIDTVLEKFANELTDKDRIVMAYHGHNVKGPKQDLLLVDGSYEFNDLMAKIEKVPADKTLLVFSTCNGEGLIQANPSKNIVIGSSRLTRSYSKGAESFNVYFFGGLAGDADWDFDKKVTVRDAYRYAVAMVQRNVIRHRWPKTDPFMQGSYDSDFFSLGR